MSRWGLQVNFESYKKGEVLGLPGQVEVGVLAEGFPTDQSSQGEDEEPWILVRNSKAKHGFTPGQALVDTLCLAPDF